MIVVDSASESVMHVSESRKRVSFVNTAVGKFTETALTLTERFPYGANFGGFEGAGAAADGIREIIRSIDVAAAVPGSYWPDFADEVDGHLYGMEEILEWYQSKLPFPSVADLADPEQGENNDSGDRL